MSTLLEEVDPEGFEARLLDCGESLRAVVGYLRTSAQNAGSNVASRRFRHAQPNAGWGVTYYVNGVPFCEIHPKRRDGHVWVLLRGADLGGAVEAGFETSEQPGWFKIHDMREAVRLVRWVVQSHDQCSERLPNHRLQPSAAGVKMGRRG